MVRPDSPRGRVSRDVQSNRDRNHWLLLLCTRVSLFLGWRVSREQLPRIFGSHLALRFVDIPTQLRFSHIRRGSCGRVSFLLDGCSNSGVLDSFITPPMRIALHLEHLTPSDYIWLSFAARSSLRAQGHLGPPRSRHARELLEPPALAELGSSWCPALSGRARFSFESRALATFLVPLGLSPGSRRLRVPRRCFHRTSCRDHLCYESLSRSSYLHLRCGSISHSISSREYLPLRS